MMPIRAFFRVLCFATFSAMMLVQAGCSSSSPGTTTPTVVTPTVTTGTATQQGTTLNYLVDVRGTGFVTSSVLTVGGSAQATTFVSSTEVSAIVAVAAGTTSITVGVVNPAASGGSSNTIAIVISGASPSLTVSGTSTVRVGGTVQFTATFTNTAAQGVNWQVNGVTGGSTANGTISTTGLYTAPAVLPSATTVTIAAVSTGTPTLTGTASESLQNPLPTITTVTATQTVPTTSFALDVKGTGFVTGSTVAVSGFTTTSNVVVSATEMTALVSVNYGTTSLAVTAVNPNPGGSTSAVKTVTIGVVADAATAARLLDQATFGATATDIAHVQAIGVDAWITEQFAATPSTIPQVDPNSTPVNCNINVKYTCVMTPWWQNVLTGPDQLRQRVGFAFSQMFVASMLSANPSPLAMPQYNNVMTNDAFGNFYTVMTDVALSPAMGDYLNMLNSAAPANGAIANENFSRENMQLFTLGLYMLNQDGSLQLDGSGNTIAPYTQDQVQAFARVFTGWTYAPATGAPTKFPITTANYAVPMQAYDPQHDSGSKILLNGTVLPAGQSTMTDFTAAMQNVFAHSNVPPFISTELIQHFVTSTPSRAYVSRVAAVFTNNGSGVRGDMKAVMRAILEDPEARAGDVTETTGGHLREPVLFLSGALRGLNFSNISSTGTWYNLSPLVAPLNEDPLRSPSVFNFFPPNYVIAESTINAPEFGIENTATVILRLSLADQIVFNKVTGFSVDLSATGTLGTLATPADPSAFVDYLSKIFMHSQMPTTMRSQIISTITPMTTVQRTRVGVYLVLTSSQYKIIH